MKGASNIRKAKSTNFESKATIDTFAKTLFGSTKKFVTPRRKEASVTHSSERKEPTASVNPIPTKETVSDSKKSSKQTFLYPSSPTKEKSKSERAPLKCALSRKEMKERKSKRRISLEVLGVIKQDVAAIAEIRAKHRLQMEERKLPLQRMHDKDVKDTIKVTVSASDTSVRQFEITPSGSKGNEHVESLKKRDIWCKMRAEE